MRCPAILFVAAVTLAYGCHGSGDFFEDVKKSLTGETKSGLDVNVNNNGARIGVKSDDGNPFYYEECSAGIGPDGIKGDCQKKFKPLFYACVAGGGVLAALLLSCCCCCCCAPCRRKRAAGYYPAAVSQSNVVLIHAEAPNPTSAPPGYNAPHV